MKQAGLDVIGSTEVVDFPELGVSGVPTKVDTGADTSSVWASNVRPTPHGLEFTLFGLGSRLYTGQTLTATDYRAIAVRNSFGVSEFRYKVRLLIAIGDRRIRAWFTLSDRQGMRYPVLLGRRLVKNKFLVDVSKANLHVSADQKRKVLMLAVHAERLPAFIEDVRRHLQTNTEIVGAGYDDLIFKISAGEPSVCLRDGTDIASFDLIYFKSHQHAYPLAVAAARYAAFCHVPFLDQELGEYVSYDKLSEAMTLAVHHIAVPPLLCVPTDLLGEYFDKAAKMWGLPLVCKEMSSAHGHKNYLLKSKADLQTALSRAEAGDQYLLQQYVPNDGYMRLVVMGRDVVLGVRRTPSGHDDPLKTHLNNPRGSANATFLRPDEIPPEAYELAIRSAEALNRQVAGIDILQDKTSKEWYILEANYAPELIGGSFPEEKRRALAAFIDTELNR